MLGPGVLAAAHGVGGGAQRVQRRVAVEGERLLGRDPFPGRGTVENGLERVVRRSGHGAGLSGGVIGTDMRSGAGARPWCGSASW
ncbi:hypothetical protein GCM10010285_65760 [Streptomyces pseudogriseolus]|uniref:Uncharacterized protein n=1 Tax=Streptomyces pseudogriseolus TaxID=36817 RepID=A0ABQ2TQ05_STREZ|nr:hypothetical protein GCM10010285_65760 [Streptomyces rubiginosus]